MKKVYFSAQMQIVTINNNDVIVTSPYGFAMSANAVGETSETLVTDGTNTDLYVW